MLKYLVSRRLGRTCRAARGRSRLHPYRPLIEALENRTLLSFIVAHHYTAGPGAASVAVEDFNEDGKADLVTPGDVLLGNGDGSFQAAQDYAAGSDSVAVGNFDGDGHLDL